jgi:hypothetical protein
MRSKWIVLVCAWFVAGSVFAEDLATTVVGRWENQGKALEFYGQGIGRSLADATRYFKYEFPADGQISLNYGTGAADLDSISISSNELRLTDSNRQETAYTKADTNLITCVQNLRQVDGAMALYALDHNGVQPNGIMDLIPAYLSGPPICPKGGVYTLTGANGHPACTIPGHNLQE